MRHANPGLSEAALAAHFEYICALRGSQRLAYVPVVASGFASLFLNFLNGSTHHTLDPILLFYITHLTIS